MAMTISADKQNYRNGFAIAEFDVEQFCEKESDEAQGCSVQRDRADLAVGKNAFPDFGEYRIDGGGEHQQAPYAVSNQSYRR